MWIKVCQSFLLVIVVSKFSCASNKTKVSAKSENSEARFVPPPPPFAPPLLYPVNAATGILVAIAIPVPTDNLNVFVSYNFEGNYNMPNLAPDSFPGPLNRLKLTDKYPAVDPDVDRTPDDIIARNLISSDDNFEETTIKIPDEDAKNDHNMMKRSLSDRNLFTRRGAYQLLESRLNANGIAGKKCILLAICESAAVSFLEDNGIIGHILHVFLTPSSSIDEDLPLEFSKAEQIGRFGKCQKYQKRCNFNVLNLISKVL